ncbi:MAG: PEP-CTERM sorting domain-containing protein [Azonexus sp.]|nr:PEP-CTERM sorting domain-containing protein [Azonexus sp.]
MKTSIKKVLLVSATCLTSLSAYANPVIIKETGLGNGLWTNGLILPVDTNNARGYWSGLQTLLIDNSKSVLAFCVDPWEWSSSFNQNYSTGNLDTIFGAPKANFIRELYSEAYSGTLLAGDPGKLNAAAFQLALWEIIADDGAAIGLQSDLTAGLVRKVASTNASMLTAANTLLSHIDGVYGRENYSYELFISGRSVGQAGTSGYQDFLVVNRIPEPGMAALMLTALGGLGLAGLRRRKQSA